MKIENLHLILNRIPESKRAQQIMQLIKFPEETDY